MTVLNSLKPGLDEKLYENALVIELEKRGHSVNQQREFPVYYDEQLIGTLIPDLIVDGKVIADPKVVTAFNDSHIAQMLGYLNITKLQVALLLNFKQATLTWKRLAKEKNPNNPRNPRFKKLHTRGRLSQVARTTSSTAAATPASIFETLACAVQKRRKF